MTVLCGGSALAADLRRPAYTPPPPPPPVYTWTGFYIGGNLGRCLGKRKREREPASDLSADFKPQWIYWRRRTRRQLPIQQHCSRRRVGLRLDIARRYREWPFCSGPRNSSGCGKHALDIHAAARFGVVLGNGALLYGKAGGGWVDNNATVTNSTTGASISASNRNSGWVVGAGVEWALAGNWSAKLEYDFLKPDDLTFGPGPFRETLSRRAARFRCSKLGSTIGSGRSSAAVTAGPTHQRSARQVRSPQAYARAEEPWVPQGLSPQRSSRRFQCLHRRCIEQEATSLLVSYKKTNFLT